MSLKTAYLAPIILWACPVLASAQDHGAGRLILQFESDAVTDLVPQARAESVLPIAAAELAQPEATMRTSEAGRIGTFAYVPTPYPNMTIALGASDDSSELGRQMDRAIVEMTRSETLFTRQHDSAPFIGLGIHSGSTQTGWSADASAGVGVFNTPEPSRLSATAQRVSAAAYAADPCGHVRVRYVF